MKTNISKNNNKKAKQKNEQTISKHEKKGGGKAILAKNHFMTLNLLVSFLNKHCKKECVHCRNYNYIIVKKIREI
jgi:lauroyl/myristoyl acyltransferase